MLQSTISFIKEKKHQTLFHPYFNCNKLNNGVLLEQRCLHHGTSWESYPNRGASALFMLDTKNGKTSIYGQGRFTGIK